MLIFTSFLWRRVGGAPDCHDGVHGGFLSDNGERPVTARREYIRANKAAGRLTLRTDEGEILDADYSYRLHIGYKFHK